MMMRLLPVLFLLFALPAGAFDTAADTDRDELYVDGSVLVFDTVSGADDGEIDEEDVARMAVLLRSKPGVTLLRLNSGGGSIRASDRMARMIADYGLDTEVNGTCESSCVSLFLAGKTRTMTRGSSIGFHLRWWGADDIAAYYEDSKADFGWDTPFDFTSWVYEDTQGEVYQSIVDVIARGVDPLFAIEMHAPRERMWFPSRVVLQAAGVLRP